MKTDINSVVALEEISGVILKMETTYTSRYFSNKEKFEIFNRLECHHKYMRRSSK